MGVMPEDRGRRWQSLLRRYGIPSEMGAKAAEETNETADEAQNQGGLERVLPDALLEALPKPRSKRKRT